MEIEEFGVVAVLIRVRCEIQTRVLKFLNPEFGVYNLM